jgi:hypothetical protein
MAAVEEERKQEWMNSVDTQVCQAVFEKFFRLFTNYGSLLETFMLSLSSVRIWMNVSSR